jgi:hypothetical protein
MNEPAITKQKNFQIIKEQLLSIKLFATEKPMFLWVTKIILNFRKLSRETFPADGYNRNIKRG